VQRIVLPLAPEAAFSKLTLGLSSWWPSAATGVAVEFDASAGAYFSRGMPTCPIAHVERHVRPKLLQLGFPAVTSGRGRMMIEIFIHDLRRRRCEVSLIHSGWWMLSQRAVAGRARYARLWKALSAALAASALTPATP
jgi:hypothetical protein